MKRLQLATVKARLSSVVDEAAEGEGTIITRHGRPEAVVIGFDEWQKLSTVPSFAELLLAFPGEPEDLPERRRKPMRDVDL